MTIEQPSSGDCVGMSKVLDFAQTVFPNVGRSEKPRAGYLLRIHPPSMDTGVLPLQDLPISAGRDDSCELYLADQSASRRHAVFECVDSEIVVSDCGSCNGTWINEVRIGCEPVILRPGDQIRAGTHVFKYLSSDDMTTQYRQAAHAMMTRDGLTGALNKQSFLDTLDREISRSIRRERMLGLILFDIDHFKSINDNYGHLAGDQVLIGVCARVQSMVRSEDLVARYGGEEFAIILPEEGTANAAVLAERIRVAIATTSFSTGAGTVATSVSLGVFNLSEMDLAKSFALPRAPSTTEKAQIRQGMLQQCDERLRQAKRRGRDQVCST